MKREVQFIIGKGQQILWADYSDRAHQLADSRARWQQIWNNREQLEEIAHSHPSGLAAFSQEDETTMTALEQALGRTLRFSVVTEEVVIVREGAKAPTETRKDEAWWVDLMRLASGIRPKVKSADSIET